MLQALERHALEEPARRCFTDGTTAGALLQAARRLQAALSPPTATSQPVVLLLPRGRCYAAAILGSLRAGSPWCALLHSTPELLAVTLRVAQPRAVLASRLQQGAGEAIALAGLHCPLLCLDDLELWGDSTVLLGSASEAEPPSTVAYVCLTSGSSGPPMLCRGTASGLLARCHWAGSAFPAAPDDVALLRTPPFFVDAAAELLAPLLAGIPLALLPPSLDGDPVRFAEFLAAQQVTRLTLTPSLLAALLPALQATPGLRLRLLFCSGEPLTTALAAQTRAALPGCRLVNIYGSCEVGADATFCEVGHAMPDLPVVPAGRPLPGVWLAVLGLDGAPVREAGARGELLVGGVGIADGYVSAPELTAARFIATPRGRAFLTGDEAAMLPCGTLVVYGRLDATVKVRGQRVALGHVEAVLASHDGVTAAAARGWHVGASELGEATVVAYAVLRDAALTPAHLRAWLALRLAPAAVPSAVIVLPALPSTATGKVDRRGLPPPPPLPLEDDGALTGPPLLTWLRRAFGTALGQSLPLASSLSLFEAGASSLAAAALCARLALPLPALVAHPTPAALAASGLITAEVAERAALWGGAEVGAAPPAKRLRLPGAAPHAHTAGDLPAWRASVAHSHGGRSHALDMASAGASSPSLGGHAESVRSSVAPAAITCSWQVHLGACVDAPPLLLLPATPHTGSRAVVGSHAFTVLCVACEPEASNRVLWQASVGDRVEAAAAALPCGTLVAVATHAGDVVALRLRDGTVCWRVACGGAITAALAADPWGGGIWAAGHGREAFCISPAGKIRWRTTLTAAASAPPAFDDALRRVYVATLAGTLLALRDDSVCVSEDWRVELSAPVFGAPCVASGSVLVCAGERMVALQSNDGALLWSVSFPGALFAAPALLDDAHALLGTPAGKLLCLRIADGTPAWELQLPGAGRACAPCCDAAPPPWWPARTPLVAAATAGGEVTLVAVESGRPRVVASAALPAQVFSAPVLHGGRLLVGCRDDCLYCLELS